MSVLPAEVHGIWALAGMSRGPAGEPGYGAQPGARPALQQPRVFSMRPQAIVNRRTSGSAGNYGVFRCPD